MNVDRRQFILRRLHSLSGIFPIGLYLIFHIMLANASILGGPERFDAAVKAIATLPPPILLVVEMTFIYLPILFHSVYGFVRVRDAELDNPLRNDNATAYLYTLQRISGVVAFFFIVYHAASTRGRFYFADTEIGYHFMASTLANPIVFGVYLLGTLAAIFHFTNGLWTFCVTWGITVGQRAQRVARTVSMLLFVAMYGTACAILVAFRV